MMLVLARSELSADQLFGALLTAEARARAASLADALALDRFLTARRAAEPSGFEDLSLAVVKLLGSGAYAAAPPDAPPPA